MDQARSRHHASASFLRHDLCARRTMPWTLSPTARSARPRSGASCTPARTPFTAADGMAPSPRGSPRSSRMAIVSTARSTGLRGVPGNVVTLWIGEGTLLGRNARRPPSRSWRPARPPGSRRCRSPSDRRRPGRPRWPGGHARSTRSPERAPRAGSRARSNVSRDSPSPPNTLMTAVPGDAHLARP